MEGKPYRGRSHHEVKTVLDFPLFHRLCSLSVCIRGSKCRTKKIAASVPSQGVVAGTERVAASMAAQPGGMSAAILLAHNIAAAKVRRQSLEILP
jgi:hypothetical protein